MPAKMVLSWLTCRFMIETWAPRKVVPAVSKQQITKWEEILLKMDSLLEQELFSFESYSKLDMEFQHY
ncbi:hypothetical protein [Neobacillus cucumis]|uniref:hypothetical protein n=1 Tax=Neobacillus cucumis TaxID=1740721 RepID=UPI0028536E75|nr:hypothetical protein [Neobacillus cucumis]MDR4949589.1 hypothetical protein [Neobacillus cucumis]